MVSKVEQQMKGSTQSHCGFNGTVMIFLHCLITENKNEEGKTEKSVVK